MLYLHVIRIKRSNSQDLDDKLDEFKRNGLRSTTGGRLGWSKEVKYVCHLIKMNGKWLQTWSLIIALTDSVGLVTERVFELLGRDLACYSVQFSSVQFIWFHSNSCM